MTKHWSEDGGLKTPPGSDQPTSGNRRRFICRASLLVICGTLVCCGVLAPEKSVPPGGVESYERVTLGGVSQAIQIRGQRRDLPVLLFLHGGPGIPEMPVSRIYGDLEKDFIVVHWDQRGTGLSYDPAILVSSMNVASFVNDTLELTHYLKNRFARRKIYLVGFSYGSQIGILAAKREPENYYAYIGISQFLNLQKSEEILDQESRELAMRQHDLKTLHALEKAGPPPYNDGKLEGEVNDLMLKQAIVHTPGRVDAARYLMLVPGSKAYHLSDLWRALKGRDFAFKSVEYELYHLDITPRVMKMNVPVHFLLGRWDTVLSATLVERYEKELADPKGKSIHWFERSGHAPHLEEPAAFVNLMRAIKERDNR